MVLTNVLGVAYTIRATLQRSASRQGHVSSRAPSPAAARSPGSLYSATKHAVTAMGESLRQELNGTGVRVTLIEPGMVDTPFFDNPRRGPPRSRRHRARRDVRDRPAAARRHQRDPRPADGAGRLIGPGTTNGAGRCRRRSETGRATPRRGPAKRPARRRPAPPTRPGRGGRLVNCDLPGGAREQRVVAGRCRRPRRP